MDNDLDIYLEHQERWFKQSISRSHALIELCNSKKYNAVQMKDAHQETASGTKFVGQMTRVIAKPAMLHNILANVKRIDSLFEESNKRIDQIISGTYDRKEMKQAHTNFVNEMTLILKQQR